MEYVAALGDDQKRGDWLSVIPSALAALVEAGITVWRKSLLVDEQGSAPGAHGAAGDAALASLRRHRCPVTARGPALS